MKLKILIAKRNLSENIVKWTTCKSIRILIHKIKLSKNDILETIGHMCRLCWFEPKKKIQETLYCMTFLFVYL